MPGKFQNSNWLANIKIVKKKKNRKKSDISLASKMSKSLKKTRENSVISDYNREVKL